LRDSLRLPHWLTRPLSDPEKTRNVRRALATHRLNTVCESARCPNRADCFAQGTATFMILGDHCTRDCGFCAVEHGTPARLDPDEPRRVAAAARDLGLGFVVITSVTRDDLPDGGARQFVATMDALRDAVPGVGVEVLVPDFGGSEEAIDEVLESSPNVFGHNIETVERLYPRVRVGADYERSLRVLERAARSDRVRSVKSALMLGLGEERDEIRTALVDMRAAGANIAYLGQYLRPSPAHAAVARFVPPAEFDEFARCGRSLGFDWISSGPFVRSSYRAESAAQAAADR
jgi:lipoic acid synthetase